MLRGALAVADAGGIGVVDDPLAGRRSSGSKPMSLYHHVANKDEILDGLVDMVFSEIELPVAGADWRSEMRRRAGSVRRVLAAAPLGDRPAGVPASPGPATLRHHDAVLGALRAAGFSRALTAHAYALLDSYVYGFALQEAVAAVRGPGERGEVAGPIMELMATGAYPHMVDMATSYYLQPGYDFADEFEFGLDLILDGLERAIA